MMVYCSFCGKSQEEVQKIIAGNNAFICNECVELAQEIIREELAEEVLADLSEVPKPIELLHILNHYVIGQDRAKRALAVAVYNHYKRIKSEQTVLGSRKRDEDVARSLCAGAGRARGGVDEHRRAGQQSSVPTQPQQHERRDHHIPLAPAPPVNSPCCVVGAGLVGFAGGSGGRGCGAEGATVPHPW